MEDIIKLISDKMLNITIMPWKFPFNYWWLKIYICNRCFISNKVVDVPEWVSGMTRNHVG